MSSELSHRRATTEQRAGLNGLDGYPHRWFGSSPDRAGAREGTDEQPDTFAAALAELAVTIKNEGVVNDQQALTVITEGAVAIIDGVEHAAVVVPDGAGGLDGRSAQGELPPLILELENALLEGPCLDALHDTSQILVTDLATDARWPRFGVQVGQLGIRSMLCTPLAAGQTILGSLSLASTRPDAFDDESMGLAAVFAAHATLALLGVHQVRNLTALAGTRDLIGQAKGILIERYRLSPDAAFQMLVRVSQNTNVPLRQVCSRLVDTGQLNDADTARNRPHR